MSKQNIECRIETKKHNANAFVAYFSAFLTVSVVVCLIASIFTFFDFSGHLWRGGLLLSLLILLIFSQVFQWEINPRLVKNEQGNIIYTYDESVNALGKKTVSYEFRQVDNIKYKHDQVVLKGRFKYKQPLRKPKDVNVCKIRYKNDDVEEFLTKYVR